MNYDLAKWVMNAEKTVKLDSEELAKTIRFFRKGISAIERKRNKLPLM